MLTTGSFGRDCELTLIGGTDSALPIVTLSSEKWIFAGVRGYVFGDIPLGCFFSLLPPVWLLLDFGCFWKPLNIFWSLQMVSVS